MKVSRVFLFFFMLLIHRAIVYLNHLGKCLSDSLSLSHPPTNFLSLFLFHPHPPLSFYIFVSYLFYYSLNFLYLSIFRFLFLPTTLDFLSGLVSLFTLSMFLFPFLSVNISLNFFLILFFFPLLFLFLSNLVIFFFSCFFFFFSPFLYSVYFLSLSHIVFISDSLLCIFLSHFISLCVFSLYISLSCFPLSFFLSSCLRRTGSA